MVPPEVARETQPLAPRGDESGDVRGCGRDIWLRLARAEFAAAARHPGQRPGLFRHPRADADVNNIQPNSRVRVADVTVGHVTKIEREGWHALLTMRLNGDVDLPANATAKIGTTSLLGSQHIELASPKLEPPQGKLRNGALIPLSHGGAYPTTDHTLAALSLVLNGGGISQVQDITEALSTAFRGREQDVRSLIGQLDKFTAYLNDQKGDIIAAAEKLNHLVASSPISNPSWTGPSRPSPTRSRYSTTSETAWSTPPTSWANSAP